MSQVKRFHPLFYSGHTPVSQVKRYHPLFHSEHTPVSQVKRYHPLFHSVHTPVSQVKEFYRKNAKFSSHPCSIYIKGSRYFNS